MACLGVLFSLDESIVNKLKSFEADEDRLDFLQNDIEEIYFNNMPERLAELDKSWDALHRSLTGGILAYNNGQFPLNHVVLGGEIMYSESDYIMILKTPDQVKAIADSVSAIDEIKLRQGYFKINESNYGFPVTNEDFEYTWNWFNDSKAFWNLAAKENRYVLFTADQ